MEGVSYAVWLELAKPVVRVAVVAGVVLVALRLAHAGMERLRVRLVERRPETEEAKRVGSVLRVVHSGVAALIVVLGVLELLAELGVNLAPLLAAAGIGGLAIGFGAQTLIKDLISGLFLLLENQVRVGDVVTIGDKGGLVESMGFRVLTLRDASGNVHIIPNGSVDRVTNMTRDYSRYVFDIGIAYREDPDEAMRVIQDVGDGLAKDIDYAADILEPLEMLGVDRFTDSAVVIRCRIKTRPIKQWRVAREFNRRLKKAFDAHGIEIPFPHHTVYFGVPKEGAAPPVRVAVEAASR
jgi:small-conductance mechanosensitive channel